MVKLIRLMSGEEILAKVIEETLTGGIVLKQPLIILPAGQGRLALVPWLPYGETENMTLPDKVIAFTIEPQKELLNEYNSATSGLVIPDSKVSSPKLTLVE